jgi:hypothetical protein
LATSSRISVSARGEFVTAGFRNRDLRAHLYWPPKTAIDQRRLSGKVRRLLRLLRAHGVIRKVPNTHRYQLTKRGRLLTAALRATRKRQHPATFSRGCLTIQKASPHSKTFGSSRSGH